ncbi:MAG: hypothetical protein R3B90_09045 [Planctomycetaceae bacterium]
MRDTSGEEAFGEGIDLKRFAAPNNRTTRSTSAEIRVTNCDREANG